jgi:hypothetical protein
MPFYVTERTFPEPVELTGDVIEQVEAVNADEGVRWQYSYFSPDRQRSYCIYEAASPDAVRAASRRAGLPADAVVEVTRVSPDMFKEGAEARRDGGLDSNGAGCC